MQDAGLLGIANAAPEAFEVYRVGLSIQAAAARSVRAAITSIYSDTLKATIPTLNVTIGGMMVRIQT